MWKSLAIAAAILCVASPVQAREAPGIKLSTRALVSNSPSAIPDQIASYDSRQDAVPQLAASISSINNGFVPNGPTSSTATAAASLTNGTLRATAESAGQGVHPGGGPYPAYASADARLFDTIFLDANSFAGSWLPIEMSIYLDGTLDATPLTGAPNTSLGEITLNAFLTHPEGSNALGLILDRRIFGSGVYQETGGSDWTYANSTYSKSVEVFIPAGRIVTLDLAMELFAQASGNGLSDFGHTAAINFTLPEGVTFTSASGGFLTEPFEPNSAVPEPATWSLFIAGFGLVGGSLRRRPAPALAT